MAEERSNVRTTATYNGDSTAASRADTGLDEDDFEQGPITRRTGIGSRVATKVESEGGHQLQKIKPMTKHSGRSVVTFFNGLFQTIIAIATLGTSITFSFILSGNTELADTKAYFTQSQVVLYLSISWLLFLLALAFASLGSTLLTFFKAHWVRDWDGDHGRHSQIEVQMYAVAISASLGGLVIGAFVFLCLVVVAYCAAVGWIALGFVVVFGLIMLAAVLYQMPWPWRSRLLPPQQNSP